MFKQSLLNAESLLYNYDFMSFTSRTKIKLDSKHQQRCLCHVRVVDLVHLKLAFSKYGMNSEDTFEESVLNVSFDELSIEG